MTTATDWEGMLKAGIAAYQSGEYEQAIATLKKLSRCPSVTFRTKAGMGLVRTYMAQQDWPKAESLCKTLGQSAKPAIQDWATHTLSKIKERSQQRKETASLSGFTPIEPMRPKKSKIGPPIASNVPVANNVPVTNSTQPKRHSETKKPPAVSMFHYAYLNNELGDDESAEHGPTEHGPTEHGLKDGVRESIPSDKETVSEEAQKVNSYEWKNAGRLSVGRSLGKMKRQQIWVSQTFGAAALYAFTLFWLNCLLVQYNRALSFIDNLMPAWAMERIPLAYFPESYAYLVWKVLGALSVGLMASPWLWDLALRFSANRQSFSNQKLRQHSPEAASLITKRCQKRRWPIPTLWKLSTDVPLIFSYGWLPRNARLVFSDGLLSELSADELATLVSYELSHWKTVYWPLLSLQGLLLLLAHQLYWHVALWGNQKSGPLRLVAGVVSSMSYCLFWLMRLPGVWVNRVRTYYGDRTAVQLTGNPNAHARALSKLAFALANSTEQHGYTPPAAEQFSLLLPASMELTRSSLYGTVPLENLFAWDSQHPLRNWMSMLDEHPPLGDRLRLLMAYAKHWRLEPEISLPTTSANRKKELSRQSWATLLRQGTPFFGLFFGSLIGFTCLLVGAVGHWLEWPIVDWMHEDPGIFWFCPLMGLGLGTFLRINRFFPDLSFNLTPSLTISEQVCNPTLLPVDSGTTKLSGTLIGRPGLANWLGQDLMIKTSNGLLRLHIFSTLDKTFGPVSTALLLALGPFGNLISQRDRPAEIIGKPIQILGWFRRGNHIWLDVDKVRLSSGRLIEGTHPTTSLLIAIVTSGLALWLLGFRQLFQEAWEKIS